MTHEELLAPSEAINLIKKLSENMTFTSKTIFQVFAFGEVMKAIEKELQ